MLISEITQPNLIEGIFDPNIFKAVFMAGPPGAGKSTVRTQLFGGTGMRVVDPDTIQKMFQKSLPEQEKSYNPYATKAEKLRRSLVKSGLGLVIDGTNPNVSKVENMKKELESLGYDTAMVLVNAPLDVIMQRIAARQAETGREVSADYAQGVHARIQQNIPNYSNLFGDTFWLINNIDRTSITRPRGQINRWLSSPPQNPIAQQWIKQELSQRQR